MRIIGGTHKGILIHAPGGLPVRPTTDKAKESLFNIIQNHFDFSTMRVLDLFSGTGNIAYEFCSRGAMSVQAVDLNQKCLSFIKETKQRLKLETLHPVKKDAFTFLRTISQQYDFIFADAPYADKRIISIPGIVAAEELLAPTGWLVVEHESNLDLSTETGYFDKRVYGQSAFSFFKNQVPA